MPRPCRFTAAWGCFPGVAVPYPRGPARYHCTLSAGHRGDHVVEIAPTVDGGRAVVPMAPLGRGRPRLDDGRTERVVVRLTLSERQALQTAAAGGSLPETVRLRALRGL